MRNPGDFLRARLLFPMAAALFGLAACAGGAEGPIIPPAGGMQRCLDPDEEVRVSELTGHRMITRTAR